MTVFTTDDLIVRAVTAAAASPVYVRQARPEAQLVHAIAIAMWHAGVRDMEFEKVFPLLGWSRPPGGVDLMGTSESGETFACEMKVGKPDESLWDAIKLADIQELDPQVRAGYLISDALWGQGADGTGLFDEPRARDVVCREAISAWPAAWDWALEGAKGIRPHTSVGAIHVAPLADIAMTAHPGRRLVAVRVTPVQGAPAQRYRGNGWPVELPDYVRPAGGRRGLTTDPCHDYPWYPSWSQKRIEALVPTLSPEAFACLRRRLMTERAWTESDLRQRVDPFRSRG